MAEYPSCLQTTVASEVPQKSSHTVPQLWLRHSSTRPSVGAVPPTSLMSLSLQTAEKHNVTVSLLLSSVKTVEKHNVTVIVISADCKDQYMFWSVNRIGTIQNDLCLSRTRSLIDSQVKHIVRTWIWVLFKTCNHYFLSAS